MAYLGEELRENGLNHMTTNCNEMYVISAYSDGDNYATVTGNKLNNTHALTPASNIISTVGDATRCTVPTQAVDITVTDASPDLYIALCDSGNSHVLAVVQSSDRGVNDGDTLNVPACIVDIEQQP